jgi:hypothetical protein
LKYVFNKMIHLLIKISEGAIQQKKIQSLQNITSAASHTRIGIL